MSNDYYKKLLKDCLNVYLADNHDVMMAMIKNRYAREECFYEAGMQAVNILSVFIRCKYYFVGAKHSLKQFL